jgi:hypothetical protein
MAKPSEQFRLVRCFEDSVEGVVSAGLFGARIDRKQV